MFVVIQAVICTFSFVGFLSEAVTENGPAPCFLKKAHERIRVNRAISEPIITKSLNPKDSEKEVISAEKESPILIQPFNSEKTQKEDKSSVNKQLIKSNVTDSVLLISHPENYHTEGTEGNSGEKESSKSNLTDSAQIIIESLQLDKTKNKEKTSKEQKLPQESLNDEGNSTEKESAIAENSSKLQKSKSDEKNAANEESSIMTKTLNSESTKNEEEKSIDKEAVFLNKSSTPHTTREEGKLTESDSLNTNLTDSIQIEIISSELEQIKDGNSTEKKIQVKEENSTGTELGKENVTVSEPILTKASNSQNPKVEEGKVTEKELISKGKQSKVRRQTSGFNSSENEKEDVGRAFLTAYENCKLLEGRYFIRIAGSNPNKAKECVVKELQKLETYPDEFVKYLDNEGIVRKA